MSARENAGLTKWSVGESAYSFLLGRRRRSEEVAMTNCGNKHVVEPSLYMTGGSERLGKRDTDGVEKTRVTRRYTRSSRSQHKIEQDYCTQSLQSQAIEIGGPGGPRKDYDDASYFFAIDFISVVQINTLKEKKKRGELTFACSATANVTGLAEAKGRSIANV